MGSPQGIIFDCDGTLADTMPLHFEAWRDALAHYQLELDEDRFYSLGGWPTRKIIQMLAVETGRSLDVDEIASFKEAKFLKNLGHVQRIEPVCEVLFKWHGKIPLGVATGADRPVLMQILGQLGLVGLFHAEVCAEDTERHKPFPDVFLEAARRIGVAPADCLVYEDTDPGVEAGRSAGMQVIDVRTLFTPRRVTARREVAR
jgi:beta-phosphoglucomutase family hydrolase